MSFLAEAAASPERDALYAEDVTDQGYVANYTKVFAHRPEVYRAWEALSAAVRSGLSLERYEVATIAAAQQRGSAYCALAHGSMLAGVLGLEAVVQIGSGTDDSPERQAIRTLAELVAAAPASVTAADLQPLRDLGFSDADVLDVILTAALRCFFSTVLSATGAEPDPALRAIDPALLAALVPVSG